MMDCLPHFHVAAYHAEAGFRSATPGIGALCRKGDLLAGAGVFSNSIGNASLYAIGGWQPWRIGEARVGAFAGVINGYRRGAMPFAAAAVSVPYRDGELHFTVIPKVSNLSPLTVGFSFTWRLP